jgi:hypothetical protein
MTIPYSPAQVWPGGFGCSRGVHACIKYGSRDADRAQLSHPRAWCVGCITVHDNPEGDK